MVCETFNRPEVLEPLAAAARAVAERRATPEQVREFLMQSYAGTPAGPAMVALLYVLRDVETYSAYDGRYYIAPAECCRAIAELREALSAYFASVGRVSMLRYVNALSFEAGEECRIPLSTIYVARAIVGRAIGEGLV